MIFWGLVLIAIGVGFFLDVAWDKIWPIILIALGVAMLLTAMRGRRRFGSLWGVWCCGPVFTEEEPEHLRNSRQV